MKTKSRYLWLFSLLIIMLVSAVVWSETPGQSIQYIWSSNGVSRNRLGQVVTSQLPGRDINGDNDMESIIISTRIGASQNGNTLKLFSARGRLLLKVDFSSAGGCAIGRILGQQRSQLIVWDYVDLPGVCHTCNHRYNLYIYDWAKSGKLKPTYYYRTQGTYPFDAHTVGPFQEYLHHKPQALSLIGLKRVPLDQASFLAIREKALRNNAYLSRFSRKYRLGPWAIFYRTPPRSEEGEFEVWEKGTRGWNHLTGGSGSIDAKEMESSFGIPAAVWEKLRLY